MFRLLTRAPALLVLIAALPGGRCPAQAEPPALLAMEPIVTDRPDFTESAETVPAGRSQLEGGYTFGRTSNERARTLGELLLRVATGPRAEIRVGVPSYVGTRGPGGAAATGFVDASLGFKVKLRDRSEGYGLRGRPDIALIGALTLPTGGRAYRENNLQPQGKLCLGWELSPNVAFSSNLNYAWASEEGERFGQVSASGSLGFGLNERVGAYLEYFGTYPGGKDGSDANYLNGGLTYLVNNDYQLDARAGQGLNGIRDDYFIGFGASRRF